MPELTDRTTNCARLKEFFCSTSGLAGPFSAPIIRTDVFQHPSYEFKVVTFS